jgi:hypothetical protein
MTINFPPEMSDETLLEAARAANQNVYWGVGPLLEEVNRRAVAAQTTELVELTGQIRSLTSQIRLLTIAVVVLGILGALLSAAALAVSLRG